MKLNWGPLLGFRKETRGQRGCQAETAEARLGKRGTTAFFGEANAFLPGQGTHLPYERSLFTEPDENNILSEVPPFSFSNKLEMILEKKEKGVPVFLLSLV